MVTKLQSNNSGGNIDML